MSLDLPRLRPDQWNIVSHPAKRKIVAAGRRVGKTVTGGTLAANALSQHGRVAWVAPTYKNTRALWRWVTAVCANDRRLLVSRSDKMISTDAGGFLAVYSADNADSIRGEAFHLVIVDEAAQVDEETINDVITPTLADYDGELLCFGTPRGKNWFYQRFTEGQEVGAEWASWQVPTSANPIPAIQRAFEMARRTLPERTFRQEFLAQFVDDGGEVFRNTRACAVANPQEAAVQDHSYIIGVDWAKHVDFNVFAVFDIGEQSLVYVDRSQSVDYSIQAMRLRALWERFDYPVIVAETNSMGEAIIDQLNHDGIPVSRFTTTNATKQAIIETLAVGFEQKTISIIDDPVVIRELEAYTLVKLPSGLIRYSAPAGWHDDCVMALAFAYWGASSQISSSELVDFADF